MYELSVKFKAKDFKIVEWHQEPEFSSNLVWKQCLPHVVTSTTIIKVSANSVAINF